MYVLLKTNPIHCIYFSLSLSTCLFARSFFAWIHMTCWCIRCYFVSCVQLKLLFPNCLYSIIYYKWESHWCYVKKKTDTFLCIRSMWVCVYVILLLAQTAFETVCINLYLSILINSNYNCVNNSVNVLVVSNEERAKKQAYTLTYTQLDGSR